MVSIHSLISSWPILLFSFFGIVPKTSVFDFITITFSFHKLFRSLETSWRNKAARDGLFVIKLIKLIWIRLHI